MRQILTWKNKVWLSAEGITLPYDRTRNCAKLCAQYYGPYKIVEQISPVSYRLALPEGCKFHDVFHVMRLKSAHENTFKHRKPKKLPAVRDKYYEVDKILSDRVKYGHKEFHISWNIKWYSRYESSRLRGEDQKCPKKIQKYLETKAL